VSALEKEIIEKVGKILTSPPKMGIVVTLGRNKSESFTNFKRKLSQTSGSLNYHLLFLEKENIVKKTSEGKYVLTDEGIKAFNIVKDVAKKE